MKHLLFIYSIFALCNGLVYKANGQSWVWAKNLGTAYPKGAQIATDSKGNIYVSGTYNYSDSFGSTLLLNCFGSVYGDIFIAKYDSTGNIIWARSSCCSYGISNDNAVYTTGIAVDKDDNLYISGYYDFPVISFGSFALTGTSGSDYRLFLVKLNANGDFIWAKDAFTFHPAFPTLSYDPNSNSIFLTGSFAIGFYFDTIQINKLGFGEDAFLIRIDTNGSPLWGRSFGTQDSNYYHYASSLSITIDRSSNITVTGRFDTTFNVGGFILSPIGGTYNGFIINYDTAGNVIWAKSVPG